MKKVAQFPLDGGMDQRTHARYVQAPALLSCTNVRFPEVGGVEKRPGTESIASQFDAAGGGGTAFSTSRGKCIGFRDSILAIDGYRIGALAQVAAASRIVDGGKVPEAIAKVQSLAGLPYALSQLDCAVSTDGLVFYVWSETATSALQSGDIFLTVQDASTGAYVTAAEELTNNGGTFGAPKVIAVGSAVLLFYKNTGNGIFCRIWDSTTRSFGSGLSPVTDNAASGLYDVATDGTFVYLAYKNTSNDVLVKKITAAGAVSATGTSTEAATDAYAFGIDATSAQNVVLVTYATTAGSLVRMASFSQAMTELVTPWTVYTSSTSIAETSVRRLSSTTAVVLIGEETSVAYATLAPVVNYSTSAVVGSATGNGRKTAWTQPASKPFVVSTSPMRVYAWVTAGGTRYVPADESIGEQPNQYTMTLVDLGCDDTASSSLKLRPIAWGSPRTTYGYDVPRVLSAVCATSSSAYVVPFRHLTSASGRIGLASATADFAHAGQWAPAPLGQSLHVAPGFFWDSSRLAEIGFVYWPQEITVNAFSNAGGTLVAGSVYRWKLHYEYVDACGLVHRSQPSEFLEATVTPGNNTATIDVPGLSITARAIGGVRLVLYRADVAVDPNTYYRVHEFEDIALNTGVETIQVVDDGSTQYDTLYTSGGALPNVQPHGCTAMVTYRGRVWTAYGNTVAYSKAFVAGDAVSFSDAFTLPLEEAADITALWVQDDTLYISTASRIYYLQADGPTDTGAANDIRTPNTVATDLGVTEPRSVVVTSIGTIYQSATGLQLLGRNREVSPEPFGSRVQNELVTYPTITSAVVHPSGSYVVLTCVNDTTGIRLVFDYASGKWSRDIILSGTRLLSSAVARGVMYSMSPGQLNAELAASSLDFGGWVTAQIDTAWFKAGGLQGYQQISKYTLQCEQLSHANVRIQSFVNYSEFASDDQTWLYNSGSKPIATMAIPEFDRTPSVQRVQAMRWQISDATPTGGTVGTGQGMSFLGLALELDVLNETFRMPAGQKG